MKGLCQLVGLLLLVALALALLGSLTFMGLGSLIARWLPLSLFQASALAIASTIAFILLVLTVVTIIHQQREYGDEIDGFDWEPFDGDNIPATPRTTPFPTTGRNQPCPCGSGNKYKYCCGQSTTQ
jgi:hypothetical protein